MKTNNKKNRKPTLKDIAQKAGVNYSTVSRVLNNTASISEKVRKRVSKVSRELGYTPNTNARALVMKRSYTIGLVVPNFMYMNGGFFQEMLIGIESEVNNRRYNLLLTNLKGEERNGFVHNVRSSSLDGALILGDILIPNDMQDLIALKVPVVILNSKLSESVLPYVCVDNEKGGMLATEHLISHGYKNLIYIGGGKKDQTTMEREKGFFTAIEAARTKIVDVRTFYCSFNTALESAYTLMKDVRLNPVGTGIFAASDNIAYGAIKFLSDNGIEIGKSVGIVGYDNIETNDYINIPLTSVDQQGRLLGEMACRMLIDIIEKIPKETSIKILPRLVKRQSCGC